MTTPRREANDWAYRLRAGDRERSKTATALAEHYAQGRLDLAEFDERSTRALSATYVDELADLLVDLPVDDSSARDVAPQRRRHPAARSNIVAARTGLLIAGLVALLVLLVFVTRGAAVWLLPLLWWIGASRSRSWAAGRRGRAWAAAPWVRACAASPRDASWTVDPRRWPSVGPSSGGLHATAPWAGCRGRP